MATEIRELFRAYLRFTENPDYDRYIIYIPFRDLHHVGDIPLYTTWQTIEYHTCNWAIYEYYSNGRCFHHSEMAPADGFVVSNGRNIPFDIKQITRDPRRPQDVPPRVRRLVYIHTSKFQMQSMTAFGFYLCYYRGSIFRLDMRDLMKAIIRREYRVAGEYRDYSQP